MRNLKTIKQGINIINSFKINIETAGSRDPHITIVGRRDNILELLGSENVNGHKVTLSMSVLSCFGG